MTRKAAWGSALSILMTAFCVLFLTLVTGCGEQAKSMDPPKIADYNKPGTVFIATKFKADVTINNITLDEKALESSLLQAAAAGQVATDENSLAAWAINEILTNPSRYIIPAAGTIDYPGQESDPIAGSGFIVNSDGYVVTNAHVVKMDDKELKQTMALSVLSSQVQQEISELESALGVKLSDDQASKMADALATAHATYMTVSNPSSESWMLMGGSANLKEAVKGMPAEIVKVGAPSPGKDVAILKVNANNLPTVTLGDDSAMREGDQAIAIGYPGAATFNPMIKQSEENIKPSMTTGTISGRKTMPGGWDVLQIDTAITHGNSGGPLFNKKGEVIGVTTFGSVNMDSRTGAAQEVQGFNFAVPVSIVKQFLTEANVTATPGQLTKTYDEGVDLASASHYSAAKEKFRQVADANKDYPYVNDQISAATTKINNGEDKSTFPVPIWLIVIIVAAVIAALAAVLILVKRGGKGSGPRYKAGQAAAPGAGQPAATAAPVAPPAAPAPPAQAPSVTTAPAQTEASSEPAVPAAGPADAETVTPVKEEAIQPATTPVAEPDAAPEGGQTAAPEPGKEEGAQPAEGPSFCANCGKPLPPDAKFCPGCAKPVNH